MFTLKNTQGYRDKHFKLSNFAALGEFPWRDCRGREMGKCFGDVYIEGIEQGLASPELPNDSRFIWNCRQLSFAFSWSSE
jgi:hypothetical protein